MMAKMTSLMEYFRASIRVPNSFALYQTGKKHYFSFVVKDWVNKIIIFYLINGRFGVC